MKPLLIFLGLISFAELGLGQGTFTYGGPELEKEKFVFLALDPCNPMGARSKITGNGYSAEIWYSTVPASSETDLKPLIGAIGSFTDFGLVNLPFRMVVPDTFGGDKINLQLRVWDNMEGAILSWAEALMTAQVARGTSLIVRDFELTGRRADGTIALGNGSLYPYMQPFVIATVCPEPAPVTLLIFGLSVLILKSMSRSREGRNPAGRVRAPVSNIDSI